MVTHNEEFAFCERPKFSHRGDLLNLDITISVQCPGCDKMVTDSFRGLRLGKTTEAWLYCEECDQEIDAIVTPEPVR